MKTDKVTDETVYRACITWNIPALRGTGRDDVEHFMRTIQLLPSAFQETDATPKRMSPIRRASEGLKVELLGDAGTAREHYEIVSKKKGSAGLLGALLIAWMANATEKDFARVERKLTGLSGPGSRDIIARSHCKLATWALDHGWVERSAYHFEEARSHAGQNLRLTLEQIGHWFGHDRAFFLKQVRDDMSTFPWIDEWADEAARKYVERQLRDSVKSPWSRTWSFGSSSPEGHDIQSAEMQASWAGALWKLPRINRQHAALVLAKSDDPSDVARGIGLWAKGSGQNVNELISANETHLTEETIEDLLVNQLHNGRSVRDRGTWLDILHALWAELPAQLVDNFVRDYQGPSPDVRPHSGPGVKELSLFAKFLVRSASAVSAAYKFGDWEAGLLARAMRPELLDQLPPKLPGRLLEAAISADVLANDDWAATGWPSVLRCWTLTDQQAKSNLRDSLAAALPDAAVSTAAIVAPGLVDERRLADRLRVTIRLLDNELEDSQAGRFTGWGQHPATELANLAIAQGRIGDGAVQRLVSIAIAPTTVSEQRRPSLSALTALAREDLIKRAQVEQAFQSVSVRSLMVDDADLEQRLEDITRLTLMAHFGYQGSEGPLLAASRDSDTQVRLLAVRAVCALSVRGHRSASFDATLLGALYDPHPRVQAEAVPALWRGHFESGALRDVARSRLAEIFPTAHRELRATIAHQIAALDSDDPAVGQLRRMAAHDRSWAVRTAVRRSGP